MRPLRARLLAGLLALLPLCATADPVGFAVGDTDLYRIDMGTGEATRIGPTGYVDIEGLAFSPDGLLFGVADAGTGATGSSQTDFLLRIDPRTGQASAVGLLGLAGQGVGPLDQMDYGLAFTCDGRLWLSSDTTSRLWEVNRMNGSTRFVGDLGTRISGLAGRGTELYGVSVEGAEGLYRIDTATAQVQLIGLLGLPDTVYDAGMDFDLVGRVWVTIDYFTPPAGIPPLRNDLARLDLASGQRLETRVITGAGSGINTIQMEGLALASPGSCGGALGPDPRPVPGPGSVLLAVLGLLALGFGLQRARHRA